MTTFQQQLTQAFKTLKQAKWVNLSHQIDPNDKGEKYSKEELLKELGIF